MNGKFHETNIRDQWKLTLIFTSASGARSTSKRVSPVYECLKKRKKKKRPSTWNNIIREALGFFHEAAWTSV